MTFEPWSLEPTVLFLATPKHFLLPGGHVPVTSHPALPPVFPGSNRGPEARSLSKIGRCIHYSAHKAYFFFGAPPKALGAPVAMGSYDPVVFIFSESTKDIFPFFVLKRAPPTPLNCRFINLHLPLLSSQSSKARTPIKPHFFTKHISAPPNEPWLLLVHTLPVWVGNGLTPGHFHLIASDSGNESPAGL